MNREKCEFCGKEYYDYELEATAIHGYYCIKCLKICIKENKEAIKTIISKKACVELR